MPETKQLLRETRDRIPPPPDVLGGLERRRQHKENVKRVVAAVVAIVVAIVGFGGWFLLERDAAPKPADPSSKLGIFAPVSGRIVYMAKGLWVADSVEKGVWAVDPNGPSDTVEGPKVADDVASTLVRLDLGEDALPPDGSGDGVEPLGWSSDGTELLVTRWEGFEGTYSVLHADGTETRLTEKSGVGARTAAISPDGSRVAFESEGLTVVDVESGSAVKLPTPAEGEPSGPLTFSPDGTQIAYLSAPDAVWVVDANGRDAHEIVANDATRNWFKWFSGMQWSPAGDRIAIGLGGDQAIYTFAPDGSDFTKVISGGSSPFWSPDGSQIAYTIRCDKHADDCPLPSGLAIADADGSNVQPFGFAASGPWHPGPIASTEPPPVAIDDPTPTPALPELRRGAEFIVFEPRGTGLGWDLAAQDPETGEVRTIVETDGIVDCPDAERCRNFVEGAEWSPDGRWLAFEVSNDSLNTGSLGPCTPTVGVWVTNALGELRQLTTPCETPPSGSNGVVEEMWEWSPDGTRIAYAQTDGGTDELLVIDPSDGSRTSLGTADIPTNWGSPGWALQWSPDGTRIAYVDGGSVSVVDVDGGERSLLADSFVDIVEIAWSPDGTHILVHDQGRYRIQVMNADGSDLHVVLEGEDACCETDWSPNGDRILYQLSTGGMFSFVSEVWTVSPDGSNPIKVFESKDCDITNADSLPVWAPNGTQVAYFGCDGWMVANADGTGEAQPIDELLWRSWRSGGLTEADLARIGQVQH